MEQWTRRAVAGVLGALVSVAAPGAAVAQPPPSPNEAYWEDGNLLRYVGGISKDNQAVITNYGRLSFLIDDVSRIVPGTGCVNVSADNTKAICTMPEDTISWFSVSLGMGADQLQFDASFDTYVYIKGGTGNDTITIGSTAGSYIDVDGEAGDDVLERPTGTSFVRLDGGEGADVMCAAGYVTYEHHTQGVFVSIGGSAGSDGAPGEGDTVCSSVLGVTGTDYPDTLVAGSGKSNLTGDGGDDYLLGGPQRDSLFGDAGNDLMIGAGGDDWLYGSTGTDTLYAGAGIDQCDDDGVDALYDCETVT